MRGIMGYKYNNINGLINELECFLDIQFEYQGKHYSICPINGAFSFGEKSCPSIDYKSIDELIENVKVGEVLLKDIITEIDLYQ
jgi:hypothetical protein